MTYTIVVTNNGLSDVTGATVADTFPGILSGVTYASVTTGTVSGNTASGSGDISDTVDMTAAATITYTVTGTIDSSATGSLANTATVSSAIDPNTSNNSDTDSDTLTPRADLVITESDSPDPVIAGENVTYTIDYVNKGLSSAENVEVTYPLPAGTTFVSSTKPGSWGSIEPPVGGTGTVRFLRTSSPAGETASFTITVKVDADTPDGTVLTSTSTVTSDTTLINTGDDSASENTTVNAEADLVIAKTDSADPVIAGNDLTYTVTVQNQGPSDAQSVVVNDTLPAGVTLVSTSGCNEDPAGVANCTLGTIAAGASKQYTITVEVDSDVAHGTVLTNSASVSSDTTDPVSGNNAITEDTTVNAEADLSISKSDAPDPVLAGEQLVYTITVNNAGPSDAQNVSVADTLPAGLSNVVTSGCTEDPNGGSSCSLGTIAAGGSAMYTITVDVDSDVAHGTVLTNSASVSSDTTDPMSGNNSTTEQTTVNAEADLSISKSDAPDPVLAGNQLVYTITVSNAGPSDAQNVSVSDTLPAGLSNVVTSGCGEDPNGGSSCSLGTIAAGGSAMYTITVDVDSDVAHGTVLSNSASVSSDTTDPVTGNNSTTEQTTVNAEADLSISKSDAPDPVLAGEQLVYSITVNNAGPSDAQNVSIADTLPAGLSNVVTSGCAEDPNGGSSCSLGTIAAGGSAMYTITVDVDSDVTHGTVLSNSASVSSDTTDPVNGNNSTTEQSTVNAEADLSISKTAAPDPVIPGNVLTYTIAVTNNGPSDVVGATVTDNFPANFVGATWSCSPDAGSTCTTTSTTGDINDTVSLQAGDTITYTVTGTVPVAAAGLLITNEASVTATIDPDSSNNSADVTILAGRVDFGDAPTGGTIGSPPDSYPTLRADDGAHHVVETPSFFLGTGVDDELEGQPDAMATGDDTDTDGDDEDSLTLLTTIVRTTASDTTASMLVDASLNSLAGLLQGWIDFNRDGDWDDAREQIFTNVALVEGTNLLSFTVPSGADSVSGDTFMRLRLGTQSNLTPRGLAIDGEVEDHSLMIVDADTPTDIDADLPSGFGPFEVRDVAGDLQVQTQSGSVIFQAPSTALNEANVDGSADADEINVVSTPAGSTTNIDGGLGNDTINVGDPTGGALDGILGALSIDGGGHDAGPTRTVRTGAGDVTPNNPLDATSAFNEDPPITAAQGDTLSINDASETEDVRYDFTLNGMQVVERQQLPFLDYTGIELTNLTGGSGVEAVVVHLPSSGWQGRSDVFAFDGRGGDDILKINGSDADDDILVADLTTDPGPRANFEVTDFHFAHLEGRGGDDNVVNDATGLLSLLEGNDGADVLVGSDSVDVLFGGAGVDALFGNGGDDYLFADLDIDGNLTVNNSELLNGGPGNDSGLGVSDGIDQDILVDMESVLQETEGWQFYYFPEVNFNLPSAAAIAALRDEALNELLSLGGTQDWPTVAEPLALIAVDQSLGLHTDGNFYENWGGLNEKWLLGTNDEWYYITPDGSLYQWHGGDVNNATFVEAVGSEHYDNPVLLYDAADTSDVYPTETDGGGTGTEMDAVAAEAVRLDQGLDLYVDNEYLNWGGLNEKWLQSRSQNGAWYYITPDGGFYQWLGGVASDATQIATLNASYYDDLAQLYNAAEQSANSGGGGTASQAAEIDAALGLHTTGDLYLNWGGLNEKWLQGTNDVWYFIRPDGRFYEWHGGSIENSTLLYTLDPLYHTDPELLYEAS